MTQATADVLGRMSICANTKEYIFISVYMEIRHAIPVAYRKWYPNSPCTSQELRLMSPTSEKCVSVTIIMSHTLDLRGHNKKTLLVSCPL